MYWNLYASYAKRNVLFKLIKAFAKSQRVSDSFENIIVKIKCLQYKHLKAEQSYFEVCSRQNNNIEKRL